MTQELSPFELTEEIVEGNKSVILFETSLRGQRAHGLNVVGYLPDGLVGELTVFFRPLAAMRLVAEVIGGHMAQRFGRRPRACAELGRQLFGSVCVSFTAVHDGSPVTAGQLFALVRNAGGRW